MIVGSPNSTFHKNISPDKPEFVSISVESINNCDNLVMLILECKQIKIFISGMPIIKYLL